MIRKSTTSSFGTLARTGPVDSDQQSPVVQQPAAGVGLSNPKMPQSGRKMLDLVNRLHSTGSAPKPTAYHKSRTLTVFSAEFKSISTCPKLVSAGNRVRGSPPLLNPSLAFPSRATLEPVLGMSREYFLGDCLNKIPFP